MYSMDAAAVSMSIQLGGYSHSMHQQTPASQTDGMLTIDTRWQVYMSLQAYTGSVIKCVRQLCRYSAFIKLDPISRRTRC